MPESKRGRTLQIRNPLDAIAVVIASGLGLGFIPFAPGTFGSLLGVGICYALIQAFKFEPLLLLNSIVAAATLASVETGAEHSRRVSYSFGSSTSSSRGQSENSKGSVRVSALWPMMY